MSDDKDSPNGLDLEALAGLVSSIERDPAQAEARFAVTTRWMGGTGSRSDIDGYRIGRREVARSHRVDIDLPFELLGRDGAANPQEMLMAAFNACMLVGYVTHSALCGIALDSVEMVTSGILDLRGFLGVDEEIKPGYDAVSVVVRLRGKGTAEQFAEVDRIVRETSPNFFNIANAIHIDATLEPPAR